MCIRDSFRFSGVRKSAVFDRERATTWDMVDFESNDITHWQKGDVRRRVPMGPQLRNLLWEWKHIQAPRENDNRIFPFSSATEDRALALMKEVASELGGALRDMTFFHNLKHYFKTQHQLQRTPNEISDFLTLNAPPRWRASGDTYRHGNYELARKCVERVQL